MRALVRRLLIIISALALLFAGIVTTLAVRTADPRPAAAWTRLADMPDPRGEVAAAVGARVTDDCAAFDSDCADIVRIVVVGGIQGAGRTVPTVSIYSPKADAWTTGPALPAARHHVSAVGDGGVVYVSGGAGSATRWKPERDVWSLSPDSDAWRELPEMPEGRMGHQMLAVGDRLYVVGGRGDSSAVLIFDTAGQTWSKGTAMPQQRDHLAAVVVGTQIWAIGGRDADLLDRVDIYDTVTDSWTDGPRLPEPMSAMAAGVLPDGIHIVGGEDPRTVPGGVIDQHRVLALGSTTWRDAPLPIIPTHGSAGIIVSDALLVVGGSRRQGGLSPLGWTGLLERFAP